MQIPECILPIVRCPNSGGKLEWADVSEVSNLSNEIADGEKDKITGLLVTADKSVSYPVRNRIIDLRPESAIATSSSFALNKPRQEHEEARQNVMEWYNSFGWQRNEDGVLNDSAFYSQTETTAYGLYEKMSHLAQAERFSGGEFLLDAASGAIAHPEYLTYSNYHRYRVCVDFSEAALKEASQKIGDHGLFILADVCQLPFADESFAGVVSGYTVQHIHKDQQRGAIEELYRVVKPGHRLCLLASQETGRSHRFIVKSGRVLNRIMRWWNKTKQSTDDESDNNSVAPPYQLYGHCWNFDWWRKCAAELSSESEIHCLRLFGKPEFDQVIETDTAVRRLRGLETLFSLFLARASSLIVLDATKPHPESQEPRS